MSTKHIAVIEIGTSQTRTFLGTLSSRMDGGVTVRAAATAKTAGMRKSEVQSAQSVSTTVEGVVDRLAKNGRTEINRINLVYSGGDPIGIPIFGKAPINNPNEVVEEEDVTTAIETMRESPEISGRTIVEEMKINFVLDGTRVVEDPCHLSASELIVNGIRTHVDTNSYRAIVDAVQGSECDVDNVFTAACCAPLGCTTGEQRRNGVLVINLGAGTTSWSISRNDRVTAVGHLAVGGDHVTNDILYAFHTGTEESAAALKHEYGQATLEGIDPTTRVDLPVNLGMKKTINLKALTTVINARLDETIRLIHAELEDRNLLENLGAGIVLCGGAALLKNLPSLVTAIFNGMPCCVGTLPHLNFPKIDDAPDRIRFAPLFGALLRAARIEAEKEDVTHRGFSLLSFFKKSGENQ